MDIGDYWYNCTQHQLRVVCDNILFWDGYTGKASKEFSTTNKKTADFVQFAFSACNIIATIQKFDRCGRERQVNGTMYKYKSIEYCVTINNKQYYRLGGTTKDKLKSDIVPLQTVDGYKYCFTMPLGTLILRKNNRIFCSFNSGKSSIANISCLISPIENGYKTFVYSGELDNGQLSDWICSPLAGRKHILMWKNANSDRPSYSVSNQALKCIKEYYRTKIILYDDEVINLFKWCNNNAIWDFWETFYEKVNNLRMTWEKNAQNEEIDTRFRKYLMKFSCWIDTFYTKIC